MLQARTPPHAWIRDHLDPDFHLCSYYDPSPREASPHHVASDQEVFAYVAQTIRPSDVVLVGFHLGDDENLIAKTVEAFERRVSARRR